MTEREWLFLLINAIGWALAGFAAYCSMKRRSEEEKARKARKPKMRTRRFTQLKLRNAINLKFDPARKTTYPN